MGMPGMRSAVLPVVSMLSLARFRALVEFCNLNGYRRPFALLDASGGYLDTLPVWSSPRRPGRPSNREALARVHGDLFHGMPPAEVSRNYSMTGGESGDVTASNTTPFIPNLGKLDPGCTHLVHQFGVEKG